MDKKDNVKKIFDSIATKYDFLNHLLSFGVDKYWRKKALKLTQINSGSILLDVACGTGDFSIEAYRMGVRKIYGADFSYNMLNLFNQKSSWIKGNNFQCNAEKMPLKDSSVTNIIVAFGVRNFYDMKEGFISFHRILKKGGKATILEFRMPKNFLFKAIYKFYFKKILPFIGGIISRDKEAYLYLPNSVEEFDEKINLSQLLKDAGFSKIISKSLSLGIVQVIIAVK
jgi:demethylmenaquinone methyltransferase / 2-methoxy-6-polyprenyl-1,4-benzoquinol methylase